ncbi:MAG TPA: hypothetical protein VJ201_07075 [Candidatus Babeliales bacterium]|nr:hypothetical protein [Candidatus Babeliales bacterium]
MNTKVLEVTRKLEKYPYLLARIEAMLEVAENSSGKYELADDVEMKLNVHLATHSKKKLPGIPDLEK